MSRGLPTIVRENLEKTRNAAIAAVEVYNRPGPRFRTAYCIVMITMAWTAAMHASFYRRRVKPWYQLKRPGDTRLRYDKVDGEPKHWDLAECLKRHFEKENPPVRKNLEFLIGLRNKIEHRNLPELDPALYGECQAALLNLEEFLVKTFGERWGLGETLAVALQFSSVVPREKAKALRRLGSAEAKTVREYVSKFRGNLPPEILQSTEYSFNVYLVPKIANRESASDLSVEFVRYDPSKPDEMRGLERLTALIKEKQVPVANKDLLKPGQVCARVKARLGLPFTMDAHSRCWKYFHVRPSGGGPNPASTDERYCVYDEPHGDYVYRPAWVDFLVKELGNPATYAAVKALRASG